MNEQLKIAFLLLGGNIGDRMHFLRKAKQELGVRVGEVRCASGIYESEAWGFEHDQRFLNQVVEVETALSPMELLNTLQCIEKLLGRTRNPNVQTYQERTIDLDILYYNHEVIENAMLTIPHKHIQDRRFTLMPLAEIAPDYIHDTLHETNSELLRVCLDRGVVCFFEKSN